MDMHVVKRYLLATAACFLLWGCNRSNADGKETSDAPRAALNPSKPLEAPSPKLAEIFVPDIIGANVSYLEGITGPAFNSLDQTNTYKVDGCRVIVGTRAGRIENIGIEELSPKCSFDPNVFFAQGKPEQIERIPTFLNIFRALGGKFESECLEQCGTTDPRVALFYSGSHADNFNELEATVVVASIPVIQAAEIWSEALNKKFGDDYSIYCGDNLNNVALSAFSKIRPQSIRVGIDIHNSPYYPGNRCSPKG